MAERMSTLYKYVPIKYVADTINNHRLFLGDGINFNDPFELTITDRKTNIIQQIQGLHILCLTNSYRNKLIWSHYADSHKGVCLTIQVPNRLVYPICYTSRRVFSDSDLDNIIAKSKQSGKTSIEKSYSNLTTAKKIAYIKDRKWNYEKEYRIVFDSSDECGLIFDDNKWFMSVKITNIYLGVNFDKNDKDIQNKIREACKLNGVKISQMELSDKNYSINVKQQRN